MNYKALKATYVEQGFTCSNYPISELHCLHPIMTEDFYSRIKESLSTTGLIHPIVIRKMTVKNLREIVERQPGALLSPSEELSDSDSIKVVVAGNNRVRAALELGYTHIDCYVPVTTDQQNYLVKQMRGGW